MNSSFLLSFICLISFSFINISAISEHFDMTIFSSLISTAEVFKSFDLSMEIVPKLSEKGIEKAKKYLKKRISGKPEYKKEEDPNTCSDEDKLVHAKVTAAKNMLIDPNAKDFGSEFIYMYISHYLDIPAQYLGSCSENDERRYYANWITNDDRDVYVSFLNAMHAIETVEKIRNAISNIKDFVEDGLDDIQESYFISHSIDKLKDNIGDFLKDQAFELLSGKTPKEIIQERMGELAELFDTTELPEEDIIKQVQESLGRDVLSKDLAESLYDSLDAIVDISIGNIGLFSAVTTMINAPLLIFTSLAPKAALTGMLYSLSGRLAGRLERILDSEDW